MSSTLLPAPELDLRALMALPESEWPDISHLVTEDDAPVDNVQQDLQQRLLAEPLESSWNPGVPFIVNTDVGVFDRVRPAVVVPDMLLALNVERRKDLDKKEGRSYFIWVYKKPPDVAVEIVSNTVGGEGEDDVKAKKYAKLGVPYYVVFDPFHCVNKELLIVYELQGQRYRHRKDNQLPDVKLKAVIWEGEFGGLYQKWLRWATPDGELIPRGIETAVKERQLKKLEQQRADKEKRRADRAEERASLLAEKLRSLGVADEDCEE